MAPTHLNKIDLRTVFLWTASLAAVIVVFRLFLRRTVRTAKLRRWWRVVTDRFHEHQLLKVPQFTDSNRQENHLYRQLSVYLNSLHSLEDSNLTNLFANPSKPTQISLSMNPNQSLDDEFLGARLRWTHRVSSDEDVPKAFVLRIRKRDKRRILRPYFQHINTLSADIDQSATRVTRLYTNASSGEIESAWKSVPFTHPATIETIAMDADVKSKVKSDLETFLKSKQYYNRLGRAWRRSYLLYGPSGTGKSSFVAAMAKLLGYDIYDVDFSKLKSDSDLKLLLLGTTSRSVILIEDFDRYISKSTSPSSSSSVSMSGVLNFMDGVVNSCCDERVMVFTMTTKDGIDPALLRPGRVDVHIHFPMCDFTNFKSLASNYLGISDRKLFPMVEEVFQSGATLSPAVIGELMVVNRNSPSRALKSVLTALQTAGGENRRPPRISGPRRSEPLTVDPGRVSLDSSDSAMVGCKEGVNEFRKLYGLLMGKSTKRGILFIVGPAMFRPINEASPSAIGGD